LVIYFRKLDIEKIKKIFDLKNRGFTHSSIAEEIKCSTTTVYYTLEKYIIINGTMIKKKDRKNNVFSSFFKYFAILKQTKNLSITQTKKIFEQNNIKMSKTNIYNYKKIFKTMELNKEKYFKDSQYQWIISAYNSKYYMPLTINYLLLNINYFFQIRIFFSI
jgi:predicted transcriptional regulator